MQELLPLSRPHMKPTGQSEFSRHEPQILFVPQVLLMGSVQSALDEQDWAWAELNHIEKTRQTINRENR